MNLTPERCLNLQSNIDLSVSKGITLRKTSRLDFHADFFNVLNHADRDNPVSDINRSDFGRVVAISSSPRIIQLGLKVSFCEQPQLLHIHRS